MYQLGTRLHMCCWNCSLLGLLVYWFICCKVVAKRHLSMWVLTTLKSTFFLLQFAYFKRILEREKKRRHVESDSEEEDNEKEKDAASGDEDMEDKEPEKEAKKSKKREPKRLKAATDDDEEEETASGDAGAATAATGSDVTVSKELLAKFQSALFSVFEELHAQQVPMDEVRQKVTAKTKLSEAELMACIEHMSSDSIASRD